MTNVLLKRFIAERMNYYEKAVKMQSGEIPAENDFQYPDGDSSSWKNTSAELGQLLHVLHCDGLALETSITYHRCLIARETGDEDYPGISVFVRRKESQQEDILLSVEYDSYAESLRSIVYNDAAHDEPTDIIQNTLVTAPIDLHEELFCDTCGDKIVWEHPQAKGIYLASSEYLDGCLTCLSCVREHCALTNCLSCQKGHYPECRFLPLKERGRRHENI
jgi:hypothetical protein